MVLERLPGWVVDNATSVREEVAPFVDATGRAVGCDATMLSRGAQRAAYHFDPARALALVDPIPESTRRALERLRRAEPSR